MTPKGFMSIPQVAILKNDAESGRNPASHPLLSAPRLRQGKDE